MMAMKHCPARLLRESVSGADHVSPSNVDCDELADGRHIVPHHQVRLAEFAAGFSRKRCRARRIERRRECRTCVNGE
jgi:hypothetical protein